MKTALVCIAKNEDNYIREWTEYYSKLGVDDIFVYQNDWRCGVKLESNVRMIEFDGSCRQLAAYADFSMRCGRAYDFAMFFDCDEFLTIKDGVSLDEFLSARSEHPSISVNWRLFGDSGLDKVENGEYSLLKRFVMCSKNLNQHVKTIVNFKTIPSFMFANPHSIIGVNGYFDSIGCDGSVVRGHFNTNLDVGKHCAYLNHYYVKTFEEWIGVKKLRGRCDFGYDSVEQQKYCSQKFFEENNINEVADTTAKDFMYGYVNSK